MREVSGSTWVFQLMIIFILIFACFLTLVLNYSKAYRVKNEMLSIIEIYEGYTPESKEIINNYLYVQGYKTKGTCPEEWYGALNLDGDFEVADGIQKYYYCVKENVTAKGMYYDTLVFYRFYLPFLGDLMTFKVEGRTKNFVGSFDRY